MTTTAIKTEIDSMSFHDLLDVAAYVNQILAEKMSVLDEATDLSTDIKEELDRRFQLVENQQTNLTPSQTAFQELRSWANTKSF